MKASMIVLALFFLVFLSLNTSAHIDRADNFQKNAEKQEELKVWSKYDFVAGDKVIFEDNLADEQVGEFPSKWDLVSGNVEIALLGDEKVISLVENRSEITPLMDTENYLPEVFTIEFDIYYYQKYNEAYYLGLKSLNRIDIRQNKVTMSRFSGTPGGDAQQVGENQALRGHPQALGTHAIGEAFGRRNHGDSRRRDYRKRLENCQEMPV